MLVVRIFLHYGLNQLDVFPRFDERLRVEESELARCHGEGTLTASLPEELPDFVGSKHEVRSEGCRIVKATLECA